MSDYFQIRFLNLASRLLDQEPIHIGEWQSTDVSASKLHATHELMNVTLDYAIPEHIADLQEQVTPNLPWAENHFRERVGGQPLNPGDEYKNWPWYKGNVEEHQTIDNNQFSHSYMERFWPKKANQSELPGVDEGSRRGIRFLYGDLQDVADLLITKPLTRQAYLPVWFPEDTGAVHGERVPCSLGYHFMIRENRLHCWYAMRSCDILRHFQDDVYLAGRLMQWICKQYNGRPMAHEEQAEPVPGPDDSFVWSDDKLLRPGNLHMTISSLHAFIGDRWRLSQIIKPADNVESS